MPLGPWNLCTCSGFPFSSTTSESITGEQEVLVNRIAEYIITQFSLKRALKIFGVTGEKATKKEQEHMHILQSFTPLDGSKLKEKQKSQTISPLMFLTEKGIELLMPKHVQTSVSKENICQKKRWLH